MTRDKEEPIQDVMQEDQGQHSEKIASSLYDIVNKLLVTLYHCVTVILFFGELNLFSS